MKPHCSFGGLATKMKVRVCPVHASVFSQYCVFLPQFTNMPADRILQMSHKFKSNCVSVNVNKRVLPGFVDIALKEL